MKITTKSQLVSAIALADTNWDLVVIFILCIVLLQKCKLNPILVMVLAGVMKVVVDVVVGFL